MITGASDGIGAALARRVHATGDRVVVVGRSPAKTAAVAGELGAPSHVVDYARLDQVRDLASALADLGSIDVLVNNAGAWFDKYETTDDGFERTQQVNFLAPVLLTSLLAPALGDAKVVWTGSMSSRWAGRLDVSRLGMDDEAARDTFGTMRAYGTSKLALAAWVAKSARGAGANAPSQVVVHPGAVATNFGTNNSGPIGRLMDSALARAILTSADAAASRLQRYVDGCPTKDWVPGGYYEIRRCVKRRQLEDAALGKALTQRTRELLSPFGLRDES